MGCGIQIVNEIDRMYHEAGSPAREPTIVGFDVLVMTERDGNYIWKFKSQGMRLVA